MTPSVWHWIGSLRLGSGSLRSDQRVGLALHDPVGMSFPARMPMAIYRPALLDGCKGPGSITFAALCFSSMTMQSRLWLYM